MIDRLLAKITDTPRYEPGTRAYDVAFYEGDDKATEYRTALLTRSGQNIGSAIRGQLFELHPLATDYTFVEFNYRAFQLSTSIHLLAEVNSWGPRLSMGNDYLDYEG